MRWNTYDYPKFGVASTAIFPLNAKPSFLDMLSSATPFRGVFGRLIGQVQMRAVDDYRDIDDGVKRRLRQKAMQNNTAGHPAAELLDALQRLVSFDAYSASGIDLAGCEVGKGLHLASTLPQDFLDAYSRAGLFKVDPLVGMLSPETPVARWHDVPREALLKPEVAALLDTLNRFNVPPRTVIGFFRERKQYGGIAFMRGMRFDDREVALLRHFGFEIYRALSTPLMHEENAHLGVTTGERLCLSLMARGLTSEQIAAHTDYTTETVTSYLKSVMRKLNVSNRPHAVAVAIRRGIID